METLKKEYKKIIVVCLLCLVAGGGVFLTQKITEAVTFFSCDFCIDFNASPTTIYRGESSTLTLDVSITPQSEECFTICDITGSDGSTVTQDEVLYSGSYNYVAQPQNLGTVVYTAQCSICDATVTHDALSLIHI